MSSVVHYPRVYLVIDNCFASKRWTRPSEWAKIVKDLGLTYIEASADNECDPLYGGPEYLRDWISQVKTAEERFGINVVNLYSGHGTYATLGLAHNDTRVRDRIQNCWLKEMIKTAAHLNAGLGFFCHAFDQAMLNDSNVYFEVVEDLYNRLAQLSTFSAEKGVKTLSVEQMYTPHQFPWTIESAVNLLEHVYARSKHPFYITIDVGHQSIQRKYQQPDFDQIKQYLRLCRGGDFVEEMWLGPESAYQIFNEALSLSGQRETEAIAGIITQMQTYYPHLFASPCDGDLYYGLRKLACWAPIIHLQQTDGSFSAHKPFTPRQNDIGIIDAKRVLEEIAAAYDQDFSDAMPPACREIYLTLEVFSATADMPQDIIRRLEDTIEYWRGFIPVDGLSLGQLIGRPQTIEHRPIIPAPARKKQARLSDVQEQET